MEWSLSTHAYLYKCWGYPHNRQASLPIIILLVVSPYNNWRYLPAVSTTCSLFVTLTYSSPAVSQLCKGYQCVRAWGFDSHKVHVLCSSRKYPYSPPLKVFILHPPLPPSRNSSLASYFPSKILAFNTPSPYKFPMTFHGVGMDFSWNFSFHWC